MSQNLIANKHFISLLIKGKRDLVRTLLNTATSRQLQALAEIFYNIGNLPLSPLKRKKLIQYRNILKHYVNNVGSRPRLVQNHYKIILNTLHMIKNFIYKLIQ